MRQRPTNILAVCALIAVVSRAEAQDQSGVIVEGDHAQMIVERIADSDLSEEDRAELTQAGVDPETLTRIATLLFDQKAGMIGREWGRVYVVLPLPEPLSSKQMEEIRWRLRLSDAQALFLRHAHETYRPRALEFWTDVTSPLWTRSADYVDAGRASAAAAKFKSSLFADCRSASQRLFAFDESFINELTPILTDKQQSRLEYVMFWRRRLLTPIDAKSFPGATVDLTGLIQHLKQEHSAEFVPADATALDAALDRYQRRLTQQMTQLVDLWRDLAAATGWWHARADATVNAHLRDIRREFETSRTRFAETAARIHKLNESTIAEIRTFSGDQEYSLLTEEYRRRAFPILYDVLDDDLGDFIIEEIEAIEPTSREAGLLRSTLESHKLRMRAIHGRMESTVAAWKNESFVRNGFDHEQYRSYRGQLHRFVAQRFDVQFDTAVLLIGAFPNLQVQIESVLADVDRKRVELLNAEGGASGLGWPGPNDDFMKVPRTADD